MFYESYPAVDVPVKNLRKLPGIGWRSGTVFNTLPQVFNRRTHLRVLFLDCHVYVYSVGTPTIHGKPVPNAVNDISKCFQKRSVRDEINSATRKVQKHETANQGNHVENPVKNNKRVKKIH